LDIDELYSKYYSDKVLDKVQNQEEMNEEDLLEKLKPNQDMGLEETDKYDELFQIKVEDFNSGLDEFSQGQSYTRNKKSFKFDTTSTLQAILRTVDKLSKKPELYYYFSISPNLLYVSTLKHRLGIQKIHCFLSHILDSLAFQKNKDIDQFIK
jgi:hypothetical protein